MLRLDKDPEDGSIVNNSGTAPTPGSAADGSSREVDLEMVLRDVVRTSRRPRVACWSPSEPTIHPLGTHITRLVGRNAPPHPNASDIVLDGPVQGVVAVFEIRATEVVWKRVSTAVEIVVAGRGGREYPLSVGDERRICGVVAFRIAGVEYAYLEDPRNERERLRHCAALDYLQDFSGELTPALAAIGMAMLRNCRTNPYDRLLLHGRLRPLARLRMESQPFDRLLVEARLRPFAYAHALSIGADVVMIARSRILRFRTRRAFLAGICLAMVVLLLLQAVAC